MCSGKVRHNYVPYILAYKSRNFGQNLAKTLSIRLIRENLLFTKKKFWIFEFWTLFVTFYFNWTYTRVDLYASIYGKWTRKRILYAQFQSICSFAPVGLWNWPTETHYTIFGRHGIYLAFKAVVIKMLLKSKPSRACPNRWREGRPEPWAWTCGSWERPRQQ